MSQLDSFNDLKELGIECNDDYDSLTEQFNKAANHLTTILTKINNENLLKLYGYYKQGSIGKCNTPKPSWYDLKAKSKWESWKMLGDMSQKEAKTHYIELINNLDPTFQVQEQQKEPGWVTVSTLQNPSLKESDKNIIDFVKEGNKEKLINLLKTGYDVNKLDDGLALIHWAADAGSSDILQIILEFGGDVNLQDADQQTPLHYAASCGHIECVKLLLKNNANKEALDGDGFTPTDVATDNTVKELLIN